MDKAVAVPNPWFAGKGVAAVIAFRVKGGTADSVHIRLYTKANLVVWDGEFKAHYSAGWNYAPLGNLELSTGIYYGLVTVGSSTARFKMMILR